MARFDLGLSDAEFGRLTPRRFHALLKRKQAADRIQFLCAGIVAAQVINFSWGAPDERVSPQDFVPRDRDELEPDINSLSPEDAKDFIIDQLSNKKLGGRAVSLLNPPSKDTGT